MPGPKVTGGQTGPMVSLLLGLVLGIAIVVGTLASVFMTLVVPRASPSRMLRGVSQVVVHIVRPVVRQVASYAAKDRVMAIVGPLALLSLFVTWLVLVVVGFGLITWWASGSSLPSALEVAGSSVFTLGVVTFHSGGEETIEFVTAGTGLLVVALVIAYLPTLYGAFSAREAEVTLLATRAGVPAWGPEVLARHHWLHLTDEIPDLYRTWERWAAAVSESHSAYPALMWFRSPTPWRSWLTALTAILDAAALQNALSPGAAPSQSRTCLQMGVGCLRVLAQTLRLPFDPDPLPDGPIRLTYEEYQYGIDRLQEVDFPFERDPEDAWRHFVGWRINYESIVDRLTTLIMAPPAPWSLRRPELGLIQWPTIINRTPDDPQVGTAPRPGPAARRLLEQD